MKKEFRLLAGIIMHPVKIIIIRSYRKKENERLARAAEYSQNYKKWERMHAMSGITNTAYTQSDLYSELKGKSW